MKSSELKVKIVERLESLKIVLKLHEGRKDWYGCIHYEAKISELELVLELMKDGFERDKDED